MFTHENEAAVKPAEITKRRIRDAAMALFVEKGVAETTVRDLARAAGIAEGTLYRHYASMDDLIWDLFSSNYAEFARRLDAIQCAHPDFTGKLDAIVAEFCRFFDAEPTLFRFLMLTQHRVLRRVTGDENNPVEVLNRIVDAAIARGEVRLVPGTLATMTLLGMLLQPAIGLVYGRLTGKFSDYRPEIAAACRRALFV
jgi:AcrR family transcriptional regulator